MTKLFRSAILGAPASGKGTLSAKIVERFDIYHISTGNIFRQHIEQKTDVGKSVEKFISKGSLVPDILVMKIVLEELNKLIGKNWLLDGFPRTVTQAQKLFTAYPLQLVINVKVPFEILLERARGRWVHPASGRVYNTSYNPPKVHGIDDVTGERLIQRPDDQEEAILKRLNTYTETTKPLLEFYKKHKVLKQFEGKESDEIWPRIEKYLLTHLSPKS